jgi:DNA polymerase-3 subunit beta
MEFSTSRKDLVSVLHGVVQGMSAKALIPVLSGVLVRAEGEAVSFEATDLEIAVRANLPADVAVPGAAVLPGRQFFDLARRLDGDRVRLVGLEGNRTRLEYASGAVEFSGYAPEEFPAFPAVEEAVSFSLPAEELKALAGQVASICDPAVPVFSGVLWEVQDGALTWVATDTHRLAAKKGPAVSGDFRHIVPAKALEIAAAQAAEGEVAVQVGPKHILFSGPDFAVVSRFVEGKYPSWRNVMPCAFSATVTADFEALAAVLERAALIAREASEKERANLVRLTFGESQLRVSAQSEIGSLAEELPVTVSGEEAELYFNVRYLLDALAAAGLEEGSLKIAEKGVAVVVQKDDGYRHLVLPVIVKGESAAAA